MAKAKATKTEGTKEVAFIAVEEFDAVFGPGARFDDEDFDDAKGSTSAAAFHDKWMDRHDPKNKAKRPFHILTDIEKARLRVFVGIATA